MYCTYWLQFACQRTELSSGLAVLVQNGLQVVYWPEFKPSGSFVLWTKYLIVKLLCYFFLLKLIRKKKYQLRHMKAAPVRTTSPAYPSPFTPQCPGISVAHKHPVKSVVLLRQSAAHHQLFNFAPSITQFILKKKKKHLLFSGIYKYLPQLSLLITKSVTKAYSTLFTNSTQIHKGAVSSGALSTSIGHRATLRSACSALLPRQTLKRRRRLAQGHTESWGWNFSRKELVLLVKELHFVS